MSLPHNPQGPADGLRRGMKILVMGLPGAGKTTLARLLRARLGCVHLNADEVRRHLYRDLGYSLEDRLEHARRMGWLCERIVQGGVDVIADFICPTQETRAAFGATFTVWIDRIKEGRFADTNRLFVPPETWDVRVEAGPSPETWTQRVLDAIEDRKNPRA
ncbi:adenylyl-sulfate kinase [Methylobacterium sp. Leaf91]|uniref:adenylyl-sulfate kinase n=1 Tax=Methylobacterium sp. Leaf91 TaxID=1736247 RepID=UPI000ABCB494|nr:adenylyl-sulfate kinase [Methylobacterium sp. Leaf91]